MTASGTSNPKMGEIGEKVSMAGLSLQGASFVAFTCILLLFGYKVSVHNDACCTQLTQLYPAERCTRTNGIKRLERRRSSCPGRHGSAYSTRRLSSIGESCITRYALQQLV